MICASRMIEEETVDKNVCDLAAAFSERIRRDYFSAFDHYVDTVTMFTSGDDLDIHRRKKALRELKAAEKVFHCDLFKSILAAMYDRTVEEYISDLRKEAAQRYKATHKHRSKHMRKEQTDGNSGD